MWHKKEPGLETVEYAVLVGICVVLIAIVIRFVISVKPSLITDLLNLNLDVKRPEVIITGAVISGILAAIWWSFNQLLVDYNQEGVVDIIELLSHGVGLNRDKINRILMAKRLRYRIFRGLVNRCLADLVVKGALKVESEKYSLKKENQSGS